MPLCVPTWSWALTRCPSLRLLSSALRLEGVTRVWGKEGYLAKAALKPEEAAKTEVPCPLSVLQEGGSAPRTAVVSLPAPAPGPSLQAEREKQQLASCLFMGLGSQGAAGPCLVRLNRSPPALNHQV